MNCAGKPWGCGREIPLVEFQTWDLTTQSEFDISGLCDDCQEYYFAQDDEDYDWEEDEQGYPYAS